MLTKSADLEVLQKAGGITYLTGNDLEAVTALALNFGASSIVHQHTCKGSSCLEPFCNNSKNNLSTCFHPLTQSVPYHDICEALGVVSVEDCDLPCWDVRKDFLSKARQKKYFLEIANASTLVVFGQIRHLHKFHLHRDQDLQKLRKSILRFVGKRGSAICTDFSDARKRVDPLTQIADINLQLTHQSGGEYLLGYQRDQSFGVRELSLDRTSWRFKHGSWVKPVARIPTSSTESE